MKISLFLFLFVPATALSQEAVQEVIGAAGGDFKNATLSVSSTLGEVVIETFSSESYIISQGFHQGNFLVSQIEEKLPFEIGIKAYPNPVKEVLIIETEDTNLSYQVLDVNGKALLNGIFTTQPMQIDFLGIPAGTYFLLIENHKTHKIIKH